MPAWISTRESSAPSQGTHNVFVERLWRSVKYEEVYLKSYPTVPAAIDGLGGYFRFYNEERLHQALAYRTPATVYHDRTPTT